MNIFILYLQSVPKKIISVISIGININIVCIFGYTHKLICMYESYIWSNIVFLNIILLLKKISDFVCLPIFTFCLFWAILFESSPHCCLTRVQIYNFIVKCLLWLEHIKKGMDIQGKYSAKTYFRYSPFF